MFPRLFDPFWRAFVAGLIVVLCLLLLLPAWATTGQSSSPHEAFSQGAEAMITQGRQIFRFDTFGDEGFWGGQLRLNDAIASGLSPRIALNLGLKVDVDALPEQLVQRIRKGNIDLDSPATTL